MVEMNPQNEAGKSEPDASDNSDDGIMTLDELLEIVAGYEKQYGMTSEEFLRQWEAGTAPDTYETNVWAMMLDVISSDEE